jgi:peptidoglycan/LPS O-acetylase OafA/YrhL
MKLSDAALGRDNNFNLVRFVAALLVIVSHSFVLVSGSPASEPLRDWLGITPGVIAVDIFFVTSGFLVTGSLLARQDIVHFFWARFLRIFPGLVAMIVVCIVVLGLLMSTCSLSAYFRSSEVGLFFVKNVTLLRGVSYTLPGVFENNPFGQAVNGSLWTLPYEVRMYVLLALLWSGIAAMSAKRATDIFSISVIAVFILSLIASFLSHASGNSEVGFWRLSFMFFSGSTFYVLRSRIVLSGVAASAVFLLTLASLFEKDAFFVTYSLGLSYCLFCVAYLPSGFIRKFNDLGDYSYGMYIYAFPVQQSIMQIRRETSVLELGVLSIAVTLLFAIVSWHVIEKRALGSRERCIKVAKATIARLRPTYSVR